MNPAQQLRKTMKEFKKACDHLQVSSHHDQKTGRRLSVSNVTQKLDPKVGSGDKDDHPETEHKDKDRPVTSNPNMGRRKSVCTVPGTTETDRPATTNVKKDRRASVSVKGGSSNLNNHEPVGQSKSWNQPSPGVKASHNVTIIIQDGRVVERRMSLPSSDLEDDSAFLSLQEASSTQQKQATRSRSPNGLAPHSVASASPAKGKKAVTRTGSTRPTPSPTPTHKKRSWSLPGAFGSEQRFLLKKESTLVTIPSSPVVPQRGRSDSLPKRGKSASLFPEGVKVDFFPDIQPPVFTEDGRVVPSSPHAMSHGVCTRYFHMPAGETTDGSGKKTTSDLPSPMRMVLPNIRTDGESPQKEHKTDYDDSNRRHSLFVLNPLNFGKLTNRPHDSIVTIDDLRPAAKYEIRTSDAGDRPANQLPDNWLEEMKKCRYLRMPKELAHRLGYDWE